MTFKDKLSIIKASIDKLQAQIDRAGKAAEQAQTDANGHIGAMESRYDTFKEEAQHLAAAHTLRLNELRDLCGRTMRLYEAMQKGTPARTAGPGPLVSMMDEEDRESRYLILFSGTGERCCAAVLRRLSLV